MSTSSWGSSLWLSTDADAHPDAPTIDTSVAHIARVYDYWLGGKDHFSADRTAGDLAVQAYPDMHTSVKQNRAFLRRTVEFLAAEAGIWQFLDIGTGLPSASNTHEVAQRIAPTSRIVYTDNDPIVLAHARALLTSGPRGVTGYLDADARDTDEILAGAGRLLDFSQPVAIMFIAMLQFITDDTELRTLVSDLLAAVPSGSYLVVSHVASDLQQSSPGVNEAATRLSRLLNQPLRPRSAAEITAIFDGLDLLEPGVVPVQEWRPQTDKDARSRSAMRGGVGRKA